MKIYYTQRAAKDLQRLHDFIATNSLKAAEKMAEKISKSIQRIIFAPLIGKEVKNNTSHLIRDLSTNRYVIRYKILKTEIHILRVWHCREDRPANFMIALEKLQPENFAKEEIE